MKSNDIKGFFNVQRGKIVRGVCGGPIDPDSRADSLRNRDRVTEFTDSSRKRFRRYLCNACARYRVFITLTYPPGYGLDGRRSKRDLDAFCKAYRRVRNKKSWSAAWFLEYQKSGRIHYHLLGTQYWDCQRVAECWYRIVGSNLREHLEAGTEIRKIRGNYAQISSYAVKYSVKTDQKQVPSGANPPGRFWGVVGRRDTVEATTMVRLSRDEGSWIFKDPEAEEIINNFNISVRRLKNSGDLSIKTIDGEGFRVVLYLWKIDSEPIRLNLSKIINKLQVNNDGKTQKTN
jgi:hypothetical protein